MMWQEHLAQAERHVALGERHVAKQHEIIANLERDGHDTVEAALFLSRLQELLALRVEHRDTLRKELGA